MGARVMDVQLGRRYFAEPQLTFHRRYEALRAFFVEDRPAEEVAARFGYKPAAFRVIISRFNSQLRRGAAPPFSSPTGADAHPAGDAARISTAPTNRRSPTAGC